MSTDHKPPAKVTPLHLIAHAVMAVALLAVVLTLSPVFGAAVGLHGRVAWVVGVPMSLLVDALWIQGSYVVDTAVKAREWKRAAAWSVAVLIIGGGSATLMGFAGHGPVAVLMPVAALVARGFVIADDNTGADRDTALRVSSRFDRERNQSAVFRANERLDDIEADRDAQSAVRAEAAEMRRQAMLGEAQTQTVERLSETFHGLNKRVEKARSDYGQGAAAFLAWQSGGSLTERLAPTLLGPVEAVRPAIALATTEDADGAVREASDVVDAELAEARAEAARDDVMALADGAGVDFTSPSGKVLVAASDSTINRQVTAKIGKVEVDADSTPAQAETLGDVMRRLAATGTPYKDVVDAALAEDPTRNRSSLYAARKRVYGDAKR